MFILPDFGRDSDIDPAATDSSITARAMRLSRTTWMMVLGPGIRQNVVVDRPVESTDLIPTLGSLLGFDARYSQGKPVAEVAIAMLPNQLPRRVSRRIRRRRGDSQRRSRIAAAAAAGFRSAAAARIDRLRLEVSRRAQGSRPAVRLSGVAFAGATGEGDGGVRPAPAYRGARKDRLGQRAGVFTEQLTAHLWTTHQIDAFRAAAVDYIAKVEARPSPEAAADAPAGNRRRDRAGRAGQSVPFVPQAPAAGRLFHEVKHADGLGSLWRPSAKRAARIRCRTATGTSMADCGRRRRPDGVAGVSYAALSPVRAALQSRMQKLYEASVFDPEAFRTRWRRRARRTD